MKVKSLMLAGMVFAALPFMAEAQRGSDGQVKIIYWQAPSILNPYLSSGTKDVESSSLVIEPLARYNEKGELVPWLVDDIPTVANGGVSEDLTTITWKITDGILWSDGTPLTAEDPVFTWQYCTHPDSGCAQTPQFAGVSTVEAVDDLTVKITFDGPKPNPYLPFTGGQQPIIQKAQFENCLGAEAPNCTDANFGPIGTGPFKVVEFRPNDVITFEANPNYREPDKPAFGSVVFKGGGDAASAARAVFETGEFDYAWNLQLAPDVIAKMLEAGKGDVSVGFGTLVERILVNLTDPSPSLGEERSTRKHPHPFLSDIRVRQALSMAIDRELLVEIGYGLTGRMTCNIVPAPDIYVSMENESCRTQDIAGANALLDEAGWTRGADGIREKDGVRLSIIYQTSTNAVRQDFQALIKQWWSEIGVETELRNISASVFFGGDPASPDTFQKFYADIEMYTNNFNGTDPEAYMGGWSCNNIPEPESQWQGTNDSRFCDEEYESLLKELSQTADLDERGRLVQQLNDILMQNYILMPLVDRGRVAGVSKTLGGDIMNTWDSELWNAADWYRIK